MSEKQKNSKSEQVKIMLMMILMLKKTNTKSKSKNKRKYLQKQKFLQQSWKPICYIVGENILYICFRFAPFRSFARSFALMLVCWLVLFVLTLNLLTQCNLTLSRNLIMIFSHHLCVCVCVQKPLGLVLLRDANEWKLRTVQKKSIYRRTFAYIQCLQWTFRKIGVPSEFDKF